LKSNSETANAKKNEVQTLISISWIGGSKEKRETEREREIGKNHTTIKLKKIIVTGSNRSESHK
jgi:hypothetical protein